MSDTNSQSLIPDYSFLGALGELGERSKQGQKVSLAKNAKEKEIHLVCDLLFRWHGQVRQVGSQQLVVALQVSFPRFLLAQMFQ